MPNPFQAAFNAQSFDPISEECNRVAAATALVAAVRRRQGGEFTISAAEATSPPSIDNMIRAFDQAATLS